MLTELEGTMVKKLNLENTKIKVEENIWKHAAVFRLECNFST